MSHHYVQASMVKPYHIMLSTVIRDFGLTAYDKLPNNLRDVVAALEEMKVNFVLIAYAVEKVIDPKKRNKLLDAKFILTPHPNFAGEIIHANKRQEKIEQQVAILKLPPAPADK
jgi:NAD(P)H-hydrate repair Nnr-like enzyme with NAD(P)H-hydrate dehydratase domain